ncbi:DUF1616 domain-containing protein [Streptomyces glaucescens]|uniref:DUF1616 domain-containing protein n=1 Tax=Streptomyces glaucescens TaxID=1907 RepID=UPI001FE761B5|nr:DUF1616 domain-containing protein [Streptomyces glaucescens]
MQTIRSTTDPGGTDTTDQTDPADPTDGTDGAERARSGPGRDLTALLAGAATAAGGLGALLAFTGQGSPLRGPFVLFFLLAAPAGAIAAALTGLDPLGRAVASLAGAVAVDMLVAQVLLATHQWSVRGGLVAVSAFSALVLLLVAVRRWHGRTPGRRGW